MSIKHIGVYKRPSYHRRMPPGGHWRDPYIGTLSSSLVHLPENQMPVDTT